MCDINKKYEGNQAVRGYKVVGVRGDGVNVKETYYSPFSFMPFDVGLVTKDWGRYGLRELWVASQYDDRPWRWKVGNALSRFEPRKPELRAQVYNENMVGRTTVFGEYEVAKKLVDDMNVREGARKNESFVLLEVVISGDLMEGTTANIGGVIPKDGTAYAGRVVESIKVIA